MKPSTNPSLPHQHTEILVVGGGAGGTAAAIQAARKGAKTILVSEWDWLGGMLTSAGVCAPDGNELSAFQTGIWGHFIRELMEQESEGLDHGWVSFFTYQPSTGAAIFEKWVKELPNLTWKTGQIPQDVLRKGDRIIGVEFETETITADIIIDGTELGDLLELGNIPYRLGWEFQSQWNEPSAPQAPSVLTKTYPVQAPTWVFYLKDGQGNESFSPESFEQAARKKTFHQAWARHGAREFMGYGGIPGSQYMINWPIHGNDYGEGVERLYGSPNEKQDFLDEAIAHSQAFADYIIRHIGRSYQLAESIFPESKGLGGGAFALHPYYRESRRLIGIDTVIEQHLLPMQEGQVAGLPKNNKGQISAVAMGNYANDHHYPSGDIPLAPKSMIWGGRWTGTAFTMPYGCLVPESIDGFLVCEKNQSVSHMANGATRLQPVVLGCGQAAGMAAALCIKQGIQPRDLDVRSLQTALVSDPVAPAAVVPFYNLPPHSPEWANQQLQVIEHPDQYSKTGNCPAVLEESPSIGLAEQKRLSTFHGSLRSDNGTFELILESGRSMKLVTLHHSIHTTLMKLGSSESSSSQHVTIMGWPNERGGWIRVHEISS